MKMLMLHVGRGRHGPCPQGAHSLAGVADMPAHVDGTAGPTWWTQVWLGKGGKGGQTFTLPRQGLLEEGALRHMN